ncbi:MAG: T9SS type A sorting domain-containing protein [Chitinivibrionales bacterium]|nr:T9SS type A sorting domain-containing protein [Chitinivibrionales bacterium]
MASFGKGRGVRLFLSILVLGFLSASWGITYYVAPDGDDGNDGSEGSPFKTLHKARDVLRDVSGGEKVVILRDGNYFLESTLTFTEQDNGTAANPVTFKNYPGETPYIFGGKRITGWESVGNNVYRAPVESGWEFWTLSENGYRAQPARHPNADDAGTANGAYEGFDRTSFTYHSSYPAQWDYSYARVQGDANGWFPDARPVSEVNFSSRLVTCDPSSYGDNNGGYYIIEGSKDFIDKDGEWALSDDGYVYYRPMNTPIADQVIVGATMLRVIEFLGSSTSSVVKHIVLEGLVLSTSDCRKIALSNKQRIDNPSDQPGEGNCEGDHMRQGLIHMENAEYCAVKYCKILNAGIMGVMMSYHAQHNTVYGCWIEGINYVGVYLTGDCAWTGPYIYYNKHNKVVSNFFTDFGMLLANGSAVQMHQSGDNDICHNEITGGKGGRRYAISAKGNHWVPMGVPLPCSADPFCKPLRVFTRNNSINFNFISNVQRTTRDVGAFEAWRTGHNSSLIHNCFHDMVDLADWTHDTRRQCIYLDDADHYTLTGNLYYNLVDCIDFGAKSFSSTMKFNDPDPVADKAAALAVAAGNDMIEFEAIGVLSDFPWQTPMGKSNRDPMNFAADHGNGTGLLGEYYNNLTFSGTPALSRIDEKVNFIWGKSEWPVFHTEDSITRDTTIGVDSLTVRWTGKIVPLFSETYTFYATSNDGVRLWIDGQQLIDEWTGGTKEATGTVDLTAGTAYDIKMEHSKLPGGREKGVQLRWQSPSQYYTLVPEFQLFPPGASLVYPSPSHIKGNRFISVRAARNVLDITFAKEGSHSVQLIAPNGRKIMQKAGVQAGTYMLPLSALANGIYLLRIKSGNQLFNRKVIVER